MISADVFNKLNILDKAADASYLRNEVISNNISNQSTPFYKRKDVSFEDALQRELGSSKYQSIGKKVANVSLNRLTAKIYTDSVGFKYRIDGNNVDPETEQAELAANQQKYDGLYRSIDSEFSSLRAVMK